MNKSVIILFFFLTSYPSAAVSINKKAGEKIVYVDGIYDLAHYGHARSFAKARTYAAQHFGIAESKVKILVGINGGDLKSYKREPVFTDEQRFNQISSFKGVDGVILNTPLAITNELIDEEKIDLVMHGDDYTPEKVKRFYGAAVKRGIFVMFPYEPGISTTAIINRATRLTLQRIIENPMTSREDRECLEHVLTLLP